MISTIAQRWRDGRASYRPIGEILDPRAYDVEAIAGDALARDFVERQHYSGTYPAARERFGLYRGPHLVGVAVFSQPVNALTLAVLPGTAAESVELGRFVLLDEVPSNGESWFLARCFELLKRACYTGIVSFSDPFPRQTAAGTTVFGGHVGTIYQASNAIYLGRAAANSLRLLPDGRTLSKRAISKVRAGERGWRYVVAQLVEAGAPPLDGDLRAWLPRALAAATRGVRHPGNHKYAWTLSRRDRRHLPASLPYPKLHGFGGGAS